MEKKISVFTTLYNKEESYIRTAVESVINQTYKNFEWVIINDCSTDNSVKIIESYNDKRIKIFHNETNKGTAFSSNYGLKLCEGEYILRMDSDDECLPNRFEVQVNFMEKNSDIMVAGSWVNLFGDNSGIWKVPSNPEVIKAKMLFNLCIPNPSVIIRRKEFLASNLLLDENFKRVEDYEFWSRAIFVLKATNIQQVLLNYRMVDAPMEKKKNEFKWILATRSAQLKKIGLTFNEDESINLHYASSDLKYLANIKIVKDVFNRILDANKIHNIYSQPILESVIGNLWLQLIVKKPSTVFASFRLLYCGVKSVFSNTK